MIQNPGVNNEGLLVAVHPGGCQEIYRWLWDMPKNESTLREATRFPTPEQNTKTSLGTYFNRYNRRVTRIARV